MIPTDFFVTDVDPSDPWGPRPREKFCMEMVQGLRSAELPQYSDLEAALALLDLVHDELVAFGTGGGQQLTDTELAAALTSLRAVTRRVGVEFEVPFRNFTDFKNYWLRKDAYGSWQARRDLLTELFDPVRAKLLTLEERSLDALVDPVSPRPATGWPAVDEEIRELRRRFQTATTPQDYRALGTHCVGVLEALSRTVYDPAVHLREGEQTPPVDKTKIRIGRFVEDAAAGPRNAGVRGVAVKAIELAHEVKHSTTPTRREAGIAADAVIMLANMLRRLVD